METDYIFLKNEKKNIERNATVKRNELIQRHFSIKKKQKKDSTEKILSYNGLCRTTNRKIKISEISKERQFQQLEHIEKSNWDVCHICNC